MFVDVGHVAQFAESAVLVMGDVVQIIGCLDARAFRHFQVIERLESPDDVTQVRGGILSRIPCLKNSSNDAGSGEIGNWQACASLAFKGRPTAWVTSS